MSSLALYRRYRPESFAEVIGQEHVTDPLQQALRNNRVNHAYLFSGPRGCGKTTSARILARCLNCENGPTPTPCGECDSCRDLARNGPGSIDVIEIDAASHGGVDDARDLREKAFFGPARSRYKIYIIDEAHMVTSAGFNALLKVVEEPPEHLKFIFATTEPEKVIGTIRSRTHHYPFRLVPPGTLRDYLGEVCGKEAIPVEDGVLPLVVRAGAGSVRDSMSVMDQLLAGAGEDGVTYAMATSLLGYTDGSLLDSVVEAFSSGDGSGAFEVVDRIIEGGNDPRRFVADLLERLRDLVVLAAVPDAAEKGLIDAPADVIERMQAQARSFGAAELSRAADLVNEGLTEMRGATSPRLQLELICARVLLPAAYGDERSVMARLDRIERGVHFSTGAGAPAMGYVPGPEAHGGAVAAGAPVPPGGGAAAARAAVRTPGPQGTPPGAPETQGAPGGAGRADGSPLSAPLAPSGERSGEAVPAGAGEYGQGPAAPAADRPRPQGAPAHEAPQAPASSPQQSPAPASAPSPEAAPASAPAAAAPGAWPTAASAGTGAGAGAGSGAGAGAGSGARRPGGWPTAAAPGGGQPAARSGPAPAPASAPQAASAAPAPQAPAAPAPAGGGIDPRQLWPNILEAVKNRRRFTWILLSQNAQVTGFDGTTLQLGFVNAGARDNFAGSGSEDVLRQALAEQFNVQWKVEAVVDPSGGGTPVPQPAGGYGGGGYGGGGGGFPGGAAPQRTAASPAGSAAPGPAPATDRPAPARTSAPGLGGSPAASQSAQSARPARPAASEPAPVAPEDDIPEDDDPDLDESALSGHDLIVRELGATVLDEYPTE
ncbi:DNA polymerase III subunit gamma and tau [Streptomyces sp. NPDC018057]|uniref:DNA polymerase III subunit gamma and tau n=1 Tax=unclassified Streptomyces TaxID=2593676 RepID=UPI0037B7B719